MDSSFLTSFLSSSSLSSFWSSSFSTSSFSGPRSRAAVSLLCLSVALLVALDSQVTGGA